MHARIERAAVLMLVVLCSLSTSPTLYAAKWEFALQTTNVETGTKVYLYDYSDRSFPYRQGATVAGSTNIECDITAVRLTETHVAVRDSDAKSYREFLLAEI